MLNDGENGLELHVSDSATVAAQQASVMTTMANLMRALLSINPVLIGVLRNRLDVDLVRKLALKAFSDDARDTKSVALISIMLAPSGAGHAAPSEQAIPKLPRNAERERFTILHSGRPADERGQLS
ncbi:hypothetical protein FHR71_005402 [Methylobacterium sp. RAS18]|nr:hypothetical protein [Methylobacterium sp. RAS18]